MISEGKKANTEKEKTLEKQEKEWSLMMLVKSPKKGEKNKESWSRDHSISEGEFEKRIQNQARRVRTKKQEQCTQVKRQDEMTQQLIHQKEQQQTMFANLQQQQHQQLQQLSQMQMTTGCPKSSFL